jgi:choline-sulfatase
MTNRIWWLVVAFASGLLNDAAVAAPPNILFVYTDDQAAWALGASGDPNSKTPHMDRLAREGAYLINAFTVTPVCSPSRAGMFASRYGCEVGITDWIQPQTEAGIGLDRKNAIWPKVLKKHGYATGLVGKWHLGTQPQFHPTKHGFDYFMGFLGGGTSPRDPTLEEGGEPHKLSGFTSDILTDRALKFIEHNQVRPFALCLHFRSPHAPYLPVGEQDWLTFSSLDPVIPDFPNLDMPRVKQLTREYHASVGEVDRNLGRVLDQLDRLELAENTIVIFTSDHGYNIGHHGILHKGNASWITTNPPPGTANIPERRRPNMFDTSLRVPALVRWPGKIQPKTIVKHTVTNLDWYPSVLAMAGAELPPDQIIHGRNMLPLLRGEQVDWDNDLYAEYSVHNSMRADMRAYRTPHWKLKRDFLNPGHDELYDLVKDPHETTNLIASQSDEAKQALAALSQKILNKMEQLKDPVFRAAQSGK